MAFMQFRNMLIPNSMTKSNFKSRKEYYTRILEAALEQVNDGQTEGYCVRTEKEIMEQHENRYDWAGIELKSSEDEENKDEPLENLLHKETRRHIDLETTIDTLDELYWADPFNSKESIQEIIDQVSEL